MLLVQLGNCLRCASHRLVVHNKIKRSIWWHTEPVLDYDSKIHYGQLLGYQKFCLVHDGQIGLALVSFNDNRYLGGKLLLDAVRLQFAGLKNFSLLEWLVELVSFDSLGLSGPEWHLARVVLVARLPQLLYRHVDVSFGLVWRRLVVFERGSNGSVWGRRSYFVGYFVESTQVGWSF